VDAIITDLQWSADRTYFITSSKDKTAKVMCNQSDDVERLY